MMKQYRTDNLRSGARFPKSLPEHAQGAFPAVFEASKPMRETSFPAVGDFPVAATPLSVTAED